MLLCYIIWNNDYRSFKAEPPYELATHFYCVPITSASHPILVPIETNFLDVWLRLPKSLTVINAQRFLKHLAYYSIKSPLAQDLTLLAMVNQNANTRPVRLMFIDAKLHTNNILKTCL